MVTPWSLWDVAPAGTWLTLSFPNKFVVAAEGCEFSGEWTLTKIPGEYLMKFHEEDPVLFVARIAESTIEATLTSKESPRTYYLLRRDVRYILEWAEREGMKPEQLAMPKKRQVSFFLKYHNYRTGLRFVIKEDGHTFYFEHNAEPQDGDEIFKYFDGLLNFQQRLRAMFPEIDGGMIEGERWFMHVFQMLFHLSERVKRRYKSRYKKRRAAALA
jgi:hypothetical protein